MDNKFDDIYDKAEINNINSKLNRNTVIFNSNLTNHIDKYSNEKKNIDKDIKENKDNLNNFINTFSNFSTNISNINSAQNSRLEQLEENKITDVQKNKINSLENIDLNKIITSYHNSIFNKINIDKLSYYIKQFFMHNIDLIRRFEGTSEMDFIKILQFEIDRNFSKDDVIKFFISVKFLYGNMNKVYWALYFKMSVHYKDDLLIKTFNKQMISKGFLFKNLATFNIDNMFKLDFNTERLIFKLFMHKVNTAQKNNVTITLSNVLEENYCNLIWYAKQ